VWCRNIPKTVFLLNAEPEEWDLRELLAHCAAGILIDTRWVVWAEGQVAGGCKTPAMMELAAVVLDPSRPWQTKDVTDLIRPALESLGFDLSDPVRLVNEYALIELSKLFLGERELWDVVGKLERIEQEGQVESSFRDVAYFAEMVRDLRESGFSRVGNLRAIEAGAWSACDAKVRELHEQLLTLYAQGGGGVPADFPAPVYCCHKEGLGSPGTETRCQHGPTLTCAACRRGSCGEVDHLFARFMTLPDSLRQGGDCTYQAYWCPTCRGLNCVQCLDLLDDFPYPPVYACRRCGGPIKVLALNGSNKEHAVEIMEVCIIGEARAGEAPADPMGTLKQWIAEIFDREYADAEHKTKESLYWGDTEGCVATAAFCAKRATAAVVLDPDLHAYLDRLDAALSDALQNYRADHEDIDGFGAATFHGIRRDVKALHARLLAAVAAEA
jgi:hypothetical protein